MHFAATSTEAASLEALSEATHLARRQAELMAKAAGGRLGKLIELSTTPGARGETPFEVGSLAARGMNEPGGLAVKPASVDLKVSVVARWAFVPAP